MFDIKLSENFRRKARLVADGHLTEAPKSVTYSSVVSRDSVRICLLLAGLNGLDIKVADVKLAYLQAPCREKVWTIANEAFFDEEGTFFKIVRALYGLSSSGAAFRSFMANMLDELNFKPSIADPDVWLRCGIRPGSTERCYECVLVHVDDIMVLSAMASLVMEALQKKLTFKNGEASDPDILTC